MENQRVFIWVAVALAAWMNYEVYQRDYGPKPAPVEAAAQLARLATISAGLAEAAHAFAAEGAPRLLQYEIQSLGAYVRQGRWDRVLKLLGSMRPRHVPLLLQAVTGRWKKRGTRAG